MTPRDGPPGSIPGRAVSISGSARYTFGMDEREEPVRLYFLREGMWCRRCGRNVNPLLHVASPFACPPAAPFGGWPEPHKDDL